MKPLLILLTLFFPLVVLAQDIDTTFFTGIITDSIICVDFQDSQPRTILSIDTNEVCHYTEPPDSVIIYLAKRLMAVYDEREFWDANGFRYGFGLAKLFYNNELDSLQRAEAIEIMKEYGVEP